MRLFLWPIVQLLPYDTLRIDSPMPLAAVIARLEAQTQKQPENLLWRPKHSGVPYAGRISENGFEIRRVIHYRNSFLPIIRGRFESFGHGTTVHMTFQLHTFVAIFALFWLAMWYSISIPVFGIGVFSGNFGPEAIVFLGAPVVVFSIFWLVFWGEVQRSRKELTAIIQGYADELPKKSSSNLKILRWWAIAAITIGNIWVFQTFFLDGFQESFSPVELNPCSEVATQSPYCDLALVQTFTEHPKAATLAFSEARQIVASGGYDKAIKVWDLQTGQLKQTLQSDSGTVQSLAIAPDQQTIVSGSGDRMVRIWDLTSDQPPKLLKGHTGQNVNPVALSADGKTIISGSYDGLRLWDRTTGQLQTTLSEPKSTSTQIGPITFRWSESLIRIFSTSADGTKALVALNGKLFLWDLQTQEKTRLPNQPFTSLNAALLSLDGKTVVTTSYTQPTTTLKTWDLATGKLKAKRVISKARESWGYAHRLALSRDRIFAFTPQGLQIWHLDTLEPEATLAMEGMHEIAVSADGKLLVGLSGDPSAQGAQIKVLQRP